MRARAAYEQSRKSTSESLVEYSSATFERRRHRCRCVLSHRKNEKKNKKKNLAVHRRRCRCRCIRFICSWVEFVFFLFFSVHFSSRSLRWTALTVEVQLLEGQRKWRTCFRLDLSSTSFDFSIRFFFRIFELDFSLPFFFLFCVEIWMNEWNWGKKCQK